MPMFIAAVFIIAEIWKQALYPATDECIRIQGIKVCLMIAPIQRQVQFFMLLFPHDTVLLSRLISLPTLLNSALYPKDTTFIIMI